MRVARSAIPCFLLPWTATAEEKAATSAPEPVVTQATMELHRAALVIDGHNDLPWKIREKGQSSFDLLDISQPQPELHTDIPRLRRGGVGAQFWSAWVPPEMARTGGATRTTLEQIDLIHRMVRRYPETFEFAGTADDVRRIHRAGKIASLVGVEGGHAIENSLGVLRMFHALGVRYLTLTHTDTIDWADSATDEARHGGLTPFGEQVVLEMNRLGMLVDISHVSAETMRDVLRVSRAPVIASHSSAFARAEHPRNVPDDVLRLVAQNGGVVMVNFYSAFLVAEAAPVAIRMFEVLRKTRAEQKNEADITAAMEQWRRENPMPRATVQTVADHIDHIVQVAGIDHVGLGSDFDGISLPPAGLEDVSCFPFVTQALLDRGYSQEAVRKILGENLLRALGRAEAVASEPIKTPTGQKASE